jgi:phosphomannomutase
MPAHKFNPNVLREYDIRGTVGKTLSTADAFALGRAFGSIIVREGTAGKTACVGYDGRLTSPELEAAVVDGLRQSGVDVIRIGRGPTPLLYFAVFHLDAGAGVMVTGSHNPKDQNGFKLMLGKRAFYGKDITRIGAVAAAGDFTNGRGRVESRDIVPAYVDKLLGGYEPSDGARNLRVAWDPGNGAAGAVIAALTPRLPGKHVLLNEVIDGTFPSHHPDPAEEKNLAQLQAAVRDNKCDVGLAFDGDGDRLGVVDGSGAVVWSDQLLVLFAREVLQKSPGASIIADVKSSQVLYDEIRRLGGQPVMWRTGHALIKDKLADLKAPLAGELSGHIFFGDRYYGFDDALYAAVRLLALLAGSNASLGELIGALPKFANFPEVRVHCPDERKFAVVSELRDRLRASGASVVDIDGVRVSTPDGWWLVRASNTEGALVVRAEARDMAGLDRLRAALTRELAKSNVSFEAG